MARVQLALNVSDIDAAVDFYSTLFGTAAHKRRPGYANFEIADPPMKLVLFEVADRGVGVTGAMNHIGVEVADPADVGVRDAELATQVPQIRREPGVECCHAVQEKFWVSDPDGVEWEVYAITNDTPDGLDLLSEKGCCA
ncbi:MAG TPA: ArsI/CadI family heavy metal resistance metalloenzyme [Acidimicrobiia bacterium]